MSLVCLTELLVCTWNPFECFRDFELLSLTFGCFRAPTIANPTGKGEACPSKSNIEDLPSLLTFLLPPGHCPSAPLGLPSFTCPLRGPQRTTLCLDEIVHTAWNRSISAPSFMDLKSVPQGTLSLGLLQGRPKKLRSCGITGRTSLTITPSQGPETCAAQAGLSHPCTSGIYKKQHGTRSPKKRARKQIHKAPGNTDISGVGEDTAAPKVSKPEQTRKKPSTKSPKGRLGTDESQEGMGSQHGKCSRL